MGALARLARQALAVLLAAALLVATAWAQSPPSAPAQAAPDLLPVPPLAGRVIDQTATLDPTQLAALQARLAAIEAETGAQIVVLLVARTAPEDIAAYGHRVADAWKIGRREEGDGVLLLVAKDDRRVRIEVARTLEGAIPDLAARRIIDQSIAPAFRAGDVAGGLALAVDALAARIRAEALPAPAGARSGARPGLQLEELGVFFFVAVPMLASVLTRLTGRKLGALLTAGAAGGMAWWFTASLLLALGVALLALVLVGVFGLGAVLRAGGHGRSLPHIGGWNGGGWGAGRTGGSWGGHGRSGGGFRSGGGGSFGGGGASGGW